MFEEKNETWYDVVGKNGETIEEAGTLKEARKVKKHHEKQGTEVTEILKMNDLEGVEKVYKN